MQVTKKANKNSQICSVRLQFREPSRPSEDLAQALCFGGYKLHNAMVYEYATTNFYYIYIP